MESHKKTVNNHDWSVLKEELAQSQSQVADLQNQLHMQSTFCCSLGATLGHLLWKASISDKMIEDITNGSRISDFFCIASSTLRSYTRSFKTDLPSMESNEKNFMMSLLGIIANIAANSHGRNILITDDNGKETIHCFIQSLPFIPAPSGNSLRKLIYMALFNLSLNIKGAKFLQQKSDLFAALTKTLEKDCQHIEVQTIAAKILVSVTFDINDAIVFNNITQMVSKEFLRKLIKMTSHVEVKTLLQEILRNMYYERKEVTSGCGSRKIK